MKKSNQDHSRVAVPMAADTARCSHQRINLVVRQILGCADVGVPRSLGHLAVYRFPCHRGRLVKGEDLSSHQVAPLLLSVVLGGAGTRARSGGMRPLVGHKWDALTITRYLPERVGAVGRNAVRL